MRMSSEKKQKFDHASAKAPSPDLSCRSLVRSWIYVRAAHAHQEPEVELTALGRNECSSRSAGIPIFPRFHAYSKRAVGLPLPWTNCAGDGKRTDNLIDFFDNHFQEKIMFRNNSRINRSTSNLNENSVYNA